MLISHCTQALRSQFQQYLIVSSAALMSALAPSLSQAGPLVIEEATKITSPDPTYELSGTVAIGGNSVIVGGLRPAVNPEFPGQDEMAAFLFERQSAGNWPFVRKLTEFRGREPFTDPLGLNVAMNSLVAAVAFAEVRVFERTAAGWVSVPSSGFALHGDLEVHSGMILASHTVSSCFDARLFQKQSGTWMGTRDFITTFPPDPEPQCTDGEGQGSDVDLASNRVIIPRFGEVQIWDRNSDGSWPSPPTAVVPLPGGTLAPDFVTSGSFATIEGDYAITTNTSRLGGPYALRRDGNWGIVGNLQRPDRAMLRPPGGLELLNGIAAVAYSDAVGIFLRDASGDFTYSAKLVPSDGSLLFNPEISGRKLIAAGTDVSGRSVAYVFELPADLSQPPLIQDDFQDRNLAEWTSIAGSTASVVSNGLSYFYRQTSVAGAAGATRTNLDMKNQSIEADVVGRSFATGTGERWFGLTVRQTDPSNYYYLTLRNTQVISLRKLVNGVVTVLASAPLPANLTTRHKVRLEAIGSRVRGYVDGQLRLDVRDTTHKHGTAGLRMFRAAADYDNVVISPNPQTTLLSDTFEPQTVETSHPPWWFTRLGSWGEVMDGSIVFAQTSLNGGRVTTNLDADDQAIQARAKATQFATGGDPWFGVVARLQDDNNFYYLTVRSSNTVSLRRLQNGQITVLDSAALPVSVGTWYTLRLEAIGSSLRGYVNERPLVETTDTTFAEGTYGLATSRATARFDNVRVTQP